MKKFYLFVVFAFVTYPSLNAVLYIPGLPQIVQDFGAPVTLVQCTVSVYVLGIILGSLLAAPVANRYGCRRALQIAVGVAFVGNGLAVVSYSLSSITGLLIARLISALGATISYSTSFTIINELYPPQTARRVIAYAITVLSIFYGLAILIGGFLVEHFGWVSCFALLSIGWIGIYFLSFCLPSLPFTPRLATINFRVIMQRFRQSFSNRLLLGYGVITGLNSGLYYAYVTNAPFLSMKNIGLTPEEFGLFNLIPTATIWIGNLLAALVAARLTGRQAIKWGIVVTICFSLVFTSLFLAGLVTWWTLFIPASIVLAGMGFIDPSSSATAMAQTTNKPRAVAVTTSLRYAAGFLVSFLISLFGDAYVMVLPLFLLALALLMALLLAQMGHFEKTTRRSSS